MPNLNNVGIAPRGGPQPGKKTPTPKMGPVAPRKKGPTFWDALTDEEKARLLANGSKEPQPMGPVAPDLVSPEVLSDFVKGINEKTQGGLDFRVTNTDSLGPGSLPAFTFDRGDPTVNTDILPSVDRTSWAALQADLGLADADLARLQDRAAADKATQLAADEAKRAQTQQTMTDRWVAAGKAQGVAGDPMAALEDTTLSTERLSQMLLAINGTGGLDAAESELGNYKAKLQADIDASIQRRSEIEAAYQAGVNGLGNPNLPQPTESTAQGRYITAGDVKHTATPISTAASTAGNVSVDDLFLQVADAIKAQRDVAQRKVIASGIETELSARESEQKYLESEKRKASQAGLKAEMEAQNKTIKDAARLKWADKTFEDSLSAGGGDTFDNVTDLANSFDPEKVSTAGPKAVAALAFERLKKYIAAGLSAEAAAKKVFSANRIGGDLTVDQIKAANLAAAAVPGATVAPALKVDMSRYQEAALKAALEQKGSTK